MSPASSGDEQTPSSTSSLLVSHHGAAASSSQLLDTSHTALEDMVLQSTRFNDAKVQLNVIKIRMLEVRNLDLQSNGDDIGAWMHRRDGPEIQMHRREDAEIQTQMSAKIYPSTEYLCRINSGKKKTVAALKKKSEKFETVTA